MVFVESGFGSRVYGGSGWNFLGRRGWVGLRGRLGGLVWTRLGFLFFGGVFRILVLCFFGCVFMVLFFFRKVSG